MWIELVMCTVQVVPPVATPTSRAEAIPSTELVRESERIVEAELVQVHRVSRHPQTTQIIVLELEASRVFLGPPEEKRLFALLAVPAAQLDSIVAPAPPTGQRSQAGTRLRAVWFLAPGLAANGESRVTKDRLAALCGTDRPHEVLAAGRARVPIDAERVWFESAYLASPLDLPPETRAAAPPVAWEARSKATFEAWLEDAVAHDLGRIVAYTVTTGPCSQTLELEPDGTRRLQDIGIRRTPDGNVFRLDRVEHARLLARFVETMNDLPPSVGASEGPCSGWRVIELRTRRGTQRSCIQSKPPEKSDIRATEEYARAVALWDALPWKQ
jgi:hypothetical protein